MIYFDLFSENLEAIAARKSTANYMILDRAKLDGAAFWPPGPEDYIKNFGLDLQHELSSYDYVLFLELPQEEHFGGLLKTRFHNYKQSAASGEILRQVWSQHPHFIRIAAHVDFNVKLQNVIKTVTEIMGK